MVTWCPVTAIAGWCSPGRNVMSAWRGPSDFHTPDAKTGVFLQEVVSTECQARERWDRPAFRAFPSDDLAAGPCDTAACQMPNQRPDRSPEPTQQVQTHTGVRLDYAGFLALNPWIEFAWGSINTCLEADRGQLGARQIYSSDLVGVDFRLKPKGFFVVQKAFYQKLLFYKLAISLDLLSFHDLRHKSSLSRNDTGGTNNIAHGTWGIGTRTAPSAYPICPHPKHPPKNIYINQPHNQTIGSMGQIPGTCDELPRIPWDA